MSLLDSLFGVQSVFNSSSVEVPTRKRIQFDGPLSVSDDSTTGTTHVRASSVGHVAFGLNDLRETTTGGVVGNTAANGGLLASDTTPALGASANKSQILTWVAGNTDTVAFSRALPSDVDGTQPVYVDLCVYTDNSGGGGIDAATFSAVTSWDGAAPVTDTATDGTPATTLHVVTATIDAADVPDAPSTFTVLLTPGAHAADPVILTGGRLRYTRKYV